MQGEWVVVRQEGGADLGQEALGQRGPQRPDATAGAIACFQDADAVAGLGQLMGAGQPGQAGAHNDDRLRCPGWGERLVLEHQSIVQRGHVDGDAFVVANPSGVSPAVPVFRKNALNDSKPVVYRGSTRLLPFIPTGGAARSRRGEPEVPPRPLSRRPGPSRPGR